MATRRKDILGILGLFLIQLANILSPKTSEKPMMVLSGVPSSCDKFRLMPVGCLNLFAFLVDLAEQPCILNRQDRLCREGFQKLDDFRTKLARGLFRTTNPLIMRSSRNKGTARHPLF